MRSGSLSNYGEVYDGFDWGAVEQNFSWYETNKVNIIYEAIDRHVDKGEGERVALSFWDGVRKEQYTFKDLQDLSSRFAYGLKTRGIKQGDRVFIFLPRSPELIIALLGVIRMGGIAGPLFEAFMEEAVKDRMYDSGAVAVVTSPTLLKRIPEEQLPELRHVILVDPKNEYIDDLNESHIFYHDLINISASEEYVMEFVERETPMLLHYTSGSTGKPKGVIQVHDAMLHQYVSGKYVYDFQRDDIYWNTADPGWITGTSAGLFAPWLNGIQVVVRGGRFAVEDWYRTLEKYQVTVWFSAPTAFRMLMGEGGELPNNYNLTALRHILSAGEPLNSEVIKWAEDVFGQPIYDNWWMTETGSTIVANYKALPIKPGSMGKPLPGIHVGIIDNYGKELPPYEMGSLAIRPPWPAMFRTVWNNPLKYQQYFTHGWFLSGDKAYKDDEGYIWFAGRNDDVINSAGKRIGPFEVESKLIEHWAVAEAGVIGIPDTLRGEVIKAFVTLRSGVDASEELKEDIYFFVKEKLAAHAAPKQIEFRDSLPKTRSGKIMRRVLKAWELGLPTDDLSTIEM